MICGCKTVLLAFFLLFLWIKYGNGKRKLLGLRGEEEEEAAATTTTTTTASSNSGSDGVNKQEDAEHATTTTAIITMKRRHGPARDEASTHHDRQCGGGGGGVITGETVEEHIGALLQKLGKPTAWLHRMRKLGATDGVETRLSRLELELQHRLQNDAEAYHRCEDLLRVARSSTSVAAASFSSAADPLPMDVRMDHTNAFISVARAPARRHARTGEIGSGRRRR